MRLADVPATAILLASVSFATPVFGGAEEDCARASDPETSLGACTALIETGAVAGTNLAIAYNNRGAARDALGENRQAIEDYDKALEIEPDYAAVYYNRGRAYDALAEYAKAIENYDRAIELDPSFADAYQNRGVSYESLGEYEKAQRDWEKAIELAGDRRARWWQGYLKEKGHYASALDGLLGPGTRSGLRACARDPQC